MNKKWWFLFVFIVSGGFALPRVFSFNTIPAPVRASSEKQFWVSDESSLLQEGEANKILKLLDQPIAKKYTVKRSDWLEKIAKQVGVSPLFIRSTNDLEDPHLHPNQQLLIQNKRGMVYITKEGETLDSILQTYEKLGGKRDKILESNPLDEMIYYYNGQIFLQAGNLLWIPDARKSYPFFLRPVHWLRISSRFGYRRHPILHERIFHKGYDLVAPYGSPVHASEGGTVSFSGWMGGYGNMIELRHSKISTRYGHLSKILVTDGQRVRRGQLIGRVGTTGLTTGPHLHFEVRRNSDGKVLPPGRYLF